jgi:DNA-directed RNA polymerase III subunit RPC8
MFVLAVIKDQVFIKPSALQLPRNSYLVDQLNSKYANKIVVDVGLGICVYDLLDVADGMLFPGSAGAHVNVKFRLAVFAPVYEEVYFLNGCF